MKWTSFGAQVIYGLIAGVVLGLIASSMPEGNWLTTALTTVGGDYVTLLKVLIPPLVMTAVITSIANLRQVTNAARLAVKTLVWFAITAFFSVLAGIGVGLIFKPGETSGLQDTSAAPSSVGSWWSFLEGIVPTNLVGLEAHTKVVDGVASTSLSFNVLQLLVVAIALGIAAVKVGEKAEPFINFNRSLLEIIQKVLWWIIRLAPIGTAALIGKAVATYGFGAMGALGKFVLTVYVGLAIVLLVIYPVTLKLHGLNVAQFYRRVWPVTSLGLVTRSSMGVMPVTEQTAEAIGVPKHYASFAVPLGATTKMDGCAAVYPAVAAIFVSQFYGVPLNFTDYVLIAVVSVLGSAATAGTTGATVMLTLTLSTLGLPLEGVGLLLAIEPIVDMGRTAVNVTGQVLVPAIVAKQEKLLDAVQFNAKRTVAEEKVSV
ncbi:dicarboxylate/amino acid:cation symporter [Corynebacterium pseudotuberculosis]|uniref:Cation:dicarboxylase symporter family transporter n=1 Tax=Corynebacterium pseudotuberculosis 258 TaxID=1168865 RepID=A0AAU8PPD1_CORPS|nr:dicarboxylate/amino acid:cation symporter [Corynebacterium pseudotuberculosis]AER69790.1 Na+/H+-dicarboxylate symporter [Corynebacterium pseudotuberculosis 1/06-A]AEQ07313.1 cation:dicarboxylase symporter family transporter [Corynebacterium pseudotuberculosis CIP 52.97]AFB73129.1 cation:dicarboxylase symporter family transporter [Corynebacterium pseudotuberculosis 316]AFK17420.1 cation:dicarboxylase symporter family transporter [Corynebacterium pseudotuberculosis 258]AFM08079.2 cation:dicar